MPRFISALVFTYETRIVSFWNMQPNNIKITCTTKHYLYYGHNKLRILSLLGQCFGKADKSSRINQLAIDTRGFGCKLVVR